MHFLRFRPFPLVLDDPFVFVLYDKNLLLEELIQIFDIGAA